MKTLLLASVVLLSLAGSASAGPLFFWDNYGNTAIGYQNRYGGYVSDNYGNSLNWTGTPTFTPRPVYPMYQPYYRPYYYQPYQFRRFGF